MDNEPCSVEDCQRDARCGIRTTRPSRADVRVTLYTDNRVAPKTAQRYCHRHGLQVLADLVAALIDRDDPE